MKTKSLFGIMILFLLTFTFIGCNKKEEKFSKEIIQQTLFDMKGTYHGTVHVVSSNGYDKTLQNALAVSRDSLKFNMPLQPLSELISDETLSERLRDISEVTVVAGYDITQLDYSVVNFGLYPKDVTILGGLGAPPTVRIVFAKNYGGDAEPKRNSIIFNMSPTELWMGDNKYENLPKITYHFEGVYE